jgi:hypothetical protein
VSHLLQTRVDDGTVNAVEPGGDGRRVAGGAVPPEGDVVLIVGAVRDMEVDVEIRLPCLQRTQHRAHLLGIRFHVIAVEVEIACVRPPAALLRTALIQTRPAIEALVPVDVEDRDEEQVHAVEQLALRATHGEIAEEHQARVLAVDLARMNATLREDDRLPGAPQRVGRERAFFGRDHHPDVAPLRALAEGDQLQVR